MLNEESADEGAVALPQVNVGDFFSMEVFGEDDLSGEFVVSETGSIRHPLLGRVLVAGMPKGQLEEYFRSLLAQDYLVDPKVSIEFASANLSRQIVINGQVSSPGVYEFSANERMTLLTAIARAGGFTDIAKEKGVRVIRMVGGSEEVIPVNVPNLLSGKDPDFILQANDRVWVPESAF